ncbi:MAG: hypothetical protein GXP55_20470 [Deltaproteobacteria bacterium]|nr:hypothetical protein [Deltaproteobacteria bacterium]
MSRARLLWACLPLVLVWGCATQSISLRPHPRAFTASDYERIYQAWTRTEDDFAWSRMHSVLHVTGTFESWEFRWAYVVRYARDYGLGPVEREAMLRASLADSRNRHRFFVTLAGERYRQSNLTGRQSAWRVLLVDERGRSMTPVGIERVRRPGAVESTYFPSVSVQRQAFRIVFPVSHADGTPTIPMDARYVILRFTGALGSVDLRWDFEPAGQAGADDGVNQR